MQPHLKPNLFKYSVIAFALMVVLTFFNGLSFQMVILIRLSITQRISCSITTAVGPRCSLLSCCITWLFLRLLLSTMSVFLRWSPEWISLSPFCWFRKISQRILEGSCSWRYCLRWSSCFHCFVVRIDYRWVMISLLLLGEIILWYWKNN